MKFSNDTSTMDIDEGYFHDPDSDDEAESCLPMVSTVLGRLLKIKNGRVVNERRTLPLRPLMPSVAPNLAATTTLVAEVVGNFSSHFPTSSMAPIPTATISLELEVVGNVSSPLQTLSTSPIPSTTVSPVVEVGDDLSFSSDVEVVGNDSSSSLSIVKVGDDLSSLLLKIITSLSIDVCHQDKEKGIVIGGKERTMPKRGFEEEDAWCRFMRGQEELNGFPYKKLWDQF
ncbi:hypothetical protein Adt_45017 [Abeliophyllum distichum]|uniref:Uncharacterized protein n=1 Tax=Abeliophyllum distichum TaxID=126358 RepID=A0ABD1PCI4_9LAMI